MVITLNEAEQRLAKFLAKARYENARSKHIHDKKIGPQSGELTDLEGIAGELAFCRLMNVYPDLQTDEILSYDCLLLNGLRVDVKTTKYRNGKILAAGWKDKNAVDVYALMVGEFPNYRFAGMISAQKLMSEDKKINLGHGIVYAAEQDELER